MKSINQLLGDPIPFLDKLFQSIEENNIDVSEYELDHICYRVETKERYEELLNQITKEYGKLLSDPVMINGRPIASIKLDIPIIYKEREISVLELPAPKEGSHKKEGFEHVEFVFDKDFEEFMKENPNLTFNTNGLSKKVNPELGVQFDDFSIKFHHQSLEYVVTVLEQ